MNNGTSIIEESNKQVTVSSMKKGLSCQVKIISNFDLTQTFAVENGYFLESKDV